MQKEVLDNHKIFLERIQINKSLGYDTIKERMFVLERSMPIKGRILEAGTGKGHFTLALAKKGVRFISIDVSEEEQRFAKLNLAYENLANNVEFKIENAQETSFLDESFDMIYMVNVLHHLKESYSVIDELVRILAIGGRLVISDFNKNGLNIMEKLHGLDGKKHEVCGITMNDVELYLKGKFFFIKNHNSDCQNVIVAEKYKEEIL